MLTPFISWIKKATVLSILFSLVTVIYVSSQSANTLWFDRPAEHFEETLVLGNGKAGASIFGGVATDSIYLNDATLWSGEPVDPNMSPEAYKNVLEIREALKNENYKLADSLQTKLQGSFSQSYMPLGTVYLNFEQKNQPTSYHRQLELEKALSTVTYEVDGITFTREYLISHDEQAMVIRLKSSKKGALNFNIEFKSLLKYEVTSNESTLEVSGYAPYHVEPSYRGKIPNPVQFDPNRGTRFTSLFKIKHTDGELVSTDKSISLKNATEAVIDISMATSFNGFDKNPATEGADHKAIAASQLSKASSKSFESILDAHLKDHQKYFSRVHLDLGETTAEDLPTDERLKRYAKGKEDKNLEVLYFQYGRYLLISSSRTPNVPANLQGIWNPYIRPPWSSNYTLNINAEENYWLAENANLSEMHQPMLGFIENIAQTGKITAKTFYGAGGWAACHNSDIWAMSNPVGDFGEGGINWANWNMGGTWLSSHLWEHYTFSQDLDFLQDKAYPLLKGAAEFCLEWLVEDEKGNLVTSPGTSPENKFITPDGYEGSTSYGSTSDLAMIRECFQQTIAASETLQTDAAFRTQLEKALAKLYPYQVGEKGNLQEWYHDWEDVDPKHRHQSHLYGLYPGHHISPEKTPELADATRTTLNIKGDETTGWSKGWRINLWARLLDGNRAYKQYRELLRYVAPDGVRASYEKGGGTYPNLFDAHPPFQIDGNFGGAAAVVEMLVQSSMQEIQLLPALPDVWANGFVEGLKARGNFEIAITWSNKVPTKVKIHSVTGGATVLKHGSKQKEVALKPNETVEFDW
ncbi:glycoside hydrolase family 95 protein [uncultured Zobellia sp.]|uniref:glycoside hydrolase family 95 protein n=1 Tax=uncultured Zobellia sp. TaxID=255433 RepID=UPI0025919E30|nr:glycoside hydrolase family 95 protein [uncultured Zobellia sp.]